MSGPQGASQPSHFYLGGFCQGPPVPKPTASLRPDSARPPLFTMLDLTAKAHGPFPWENADNFFHLINLRDMATSSALWQKERQKKKKGTMCITVWMSPSEGDDAWVIIRFGSPAELFQIFGFLELPPAESTQVLTYFDCQALRDNLFLAQLLVTSRRRQWEEKECVEKTQAVQIRAAGNLHDFYLALCVGGTCASDICRSLS